MFYFNRIFDFNVTYYKERKHDEKILQIVS